jgi:shikimate kinase
MRIFLTGFMGSGKTTIGPSLATQLGYKFIDQDELIEKHYNMSVGEVFAKFGEAKFRKTERHVLVEVVTSDNLVISTGGGAPCFFNNMEFMNRYGLTVYLRAEPLTLVNRLKKLTDTRPLLKGKTEEVLMQFITDKLNEREPFYQKATLNIQTDSLNAAQVIDKIVEFNLKAVNK